MDKNLYEAIFKRKSFHLFRNVGDLNIKNEELKEIEDYFNSCDVLDKTIKVKLRIIKNDIICKRGQEYCLMFYSEKKNNYLENIGYIGEQLDLYLVSKNIGTLWYGIGRPDIKEIDGLDYVIMIVIKKIDDPSKFRKDMFKSKRKDITEIWHSDKLLEIANISRFSPSACNTQPWDVSINDNEMIVLRKTSKRGIMPKGLNVYYNSIDMGIFLCLLDLCFNKNNISYERIMFDSNIKELETPVCKYKIESI